MDKKLEKKRDKIKERIAQLQNDAVRALVKKDSNKAEINLPKIQKDLAELHRQLTALK